MNLNLDLQKRLSRFVIVGIILFLLPIQSFSLDVDASYNVYHTSDYSYLEICLHVIGKSLQHQDSTELQRGVEFLIVVKDGETIEAFEKYKVSLDSIFDFQNLKRFKLTEGFKSIEIEAVDLSESTNKVTLDHKVEIRKPSASNYLSAIQVFSQVDQNPLTLGISKSSFSGEFLAFNFAGPSLNQLWCYSEYFVDQDVDRYLSVSLCTGSYKADVKTEIIRQTIDKIKVKDLSVSLNQVDLTGIPSGNYHIRIELIDRSKNVLAHSYYNFQRSNPIQDLSLLQKNDKNFESSFVHKLESTKLNYYLRAHFPIAEYSMSGVLNSIIKNKNEKSKRYFLYKFWTDQSIEFAEELFLKYMKVADAIDQMYNSGFGYGFETDRGYFYLKYGQPSQSITVTDDPSAPPYEMWVYDELKETNQNNVKFVFYNPSLSHNDFILLHSTCIGQTSNAEWDVVLYQNALSETPGAGFDGRSSQDNFGRNARQLYNDL